MANASSVFSPNCPSEINTSQKLVDFFKGWHAFSPRFHHYLSNIEMYEGHPEALVCLKPDKHGDEKIIWRFKPGNKNYIVCQYSDTKVQLLKPLPSSVTQCTLWYKAYSLNKSGGNIPDHVLCQ